MVMNVMTNSAVNTEQLCTFKSVRSSSLLSVTSPQSLFNASSGNDKPEALRARASTSNTKNHGL